MLDNPADIGWNSTDDVVPVRSIVEPTVTDTSDAEKPSMRMPNPQLASGSKGMTYSAVLGILLAIGAVALYLGVDVGNFTLMGDVTTPQRLVTILITEDGHFSPDFVEIYGGESVTIENKNADPQVLKSKSGEDLFPVQVLFDQPYTFTVPNEVIGPFVYYSETLPEERTVTFMVKTNEATPPIEQVTEPIPLPFNAEPPTPPMEQPVTVPEPTVTTEHSGDTATISLGNIAMENQGTVVNSGTLPTNPYTVDKQPATQYISKAEALHSGAPLMATVRPRVVSSTGPEGFLLLFLPAIIGVMLVARKYSY